MKFGSLKFSNVNDEKSDVGSNSYPGRSLVQHKSTLAANKVLCGNAVWTVAANKLVHSCTFSSISYMFD